MNIFRASFHPMVLLQVTPIGSVNNYPFERYTFERYYSDPPALLMLVNFPPIFPIAD